MRARTVGRPLRLRGVAIDRVSVIVPSSYGEAFGTVGVLVAIAVMLHQASPATSVGGGVQFTVRRALLPLLALIRSCLRSR